MKLIKQLFILAHLVSGTRGKVLNEYTHDDALAEVNQKSALTDPAKLWTRTKIPITYASNLSLEAIASIELARQEYRLRTCLDFVNRTTEENYIAFEDNIVGCNSMIGMVGGPQTIYMASDCGQMSQACLLMALAIGIKFEHSRADRDDYVWIESSNVEPGKEHNFVKYGWDTTDASRDSYDYNSLMHYNSTAHSINGYITISTLNPAFHDVIGQRSTLSSGDSIKINRIYNCGDTLLYSYNCNYEEESACGYSQEYETDDLDWLRSQNGYMLLDTSRQINGQRGEMKSMRMVSKGERQCLQFSFYMARDAISTANLTVHIGIIDDVTGEITNLSDPVATIDGDFDRWSVVRVPIQTPAAYKLVFNGRSGGFANDIIAVDDVSVQDKPCETSYFVVNDYSSVLAASREDSYFYSPVMHTDDGYAFKIQIYPVGRSVSEYGYMGMYFGLVQGDDDDSLAWPFCNRYIRLMVVDQSKNPLYAMNKYREYLTSQDNGGDRWNQPNSSSFRSYGYRNFMMVNDLIVAHNYLKNDALMISVLVQDMNWVRGDVCNGNFTRQSSSKWRDNDEIEDIEDAEVAVDDD